MYQPYTTSGQSAEPLRPPAPAPVRTAVKLMYAGAAVSTVPLIIALPYTSDIKDFHWNGHSLTAAQFSHWRPLIIMVAIVGGLVVAALWLWMARTNGQGRNWARILSTVLFGLATLQLTSIFRTPVYQTPAWTIAVGQLVQLLTWLVGLGAVWLLWRPASSAFFKPQGFARMPPARPTLPGPPPRLL